MFTFEVKFENLSKDIFESVQIGTTIVTIGNFLVSDRLYCVENIGNTAY
jgi:hypothetical protein